MKYIGLLSLLIVMSCSESAENNDAAEAVEEETTTQTAEDEAIVQSPDTIIFEGAEYVKVNDSTYNREDDIYTTYLELYPGGKVRSVKHQGEFHACGALVDTSKYFDENAILVKTIFHDNYMPDGGEGCHDSMQDHYVTEYYSNGNIKASKMFRNSYQGEELEAGVWKEFDEKGKLIGSKDYGDPYEELMP